MTPGRLKMKRKAQDEHEHERENEDCCQGSAAIKCRVLFGAAEGCKQKSARQISLRSLIA